jgi:hypothetical protein
LAAKKVKISLHISKTEFGAQIQYGCVKFPSIGNFIWNKKKYTFGVEKAKKKVQSPKEKQVGISKNAHKKSLIALKSKKQTSNLEDSVVFTFYMNEVNIKY